MKVKHLIRELNRCNQDAEVRLIMSDPEEDYEKSFHSYRVHQHSYETKDWNNYTVYICAFPAEYNNDDDTPEPTARFQTKRERGLE